MIKAISPSSQKIAEKLVILNERTTGIITRIYNIKKACGDLKSKPKFLSDRSLENALKTITKKFPGLDNRNSSVKTVVQSINAIKQDIIKALSLYYNTFVDLMDLKDHITELLTIIDACQLHLNITVNYDLTQLYLNLVCNYVAMMILLSRIEDRKTVPGLYNAAYELQNGVHDTCFPRLGQMIVDYEQPLRKLSEEFVPHSKVLLGAINSLAAVYVRRNLTADKWRAGQILSLVTASNQLLAVAQTDTMPCEYLSLETMNRWIICKIANRFFFSLLICHNAIAQPVFCDLWRQGLESGLAITLFRDEVLYIHNVAQTYFDSIKGYNKRVAELKEFVATAVQHSLQVHSDRRKFLRTALKELFLIFTDQPGLLAPKVLLVLMALSFSKDEVDWLMRHSNCWPQKSGNKGRGYEDISDRVLPEMLFYMVELRELLLRYRSVVQRYHVQYLAGFDALALNELLQSIASIPQESSVIFSDFCQAIAELNVEDLENDSVAYNFQGLRLDWYRLQAYTSSARFGFCLHDHAKLAQLMNTIVFHLKMIDFLDQIINETSDLSSYCFYSVLFEEQFRLCLESPSQSRYVCVFPKLCSHFANCLHNLCPEERIHIEEKGLSLCNLFLDEIAKETRNVVSTAYEQHRLLSEELLPKTCAKLIANAINKENRKKSNFMTLEKKSFKRSLSPQHGYPGDESYRRSREDMTLIDKLHFALTELCFAIDYYPQIVVWEHTFAPREYLTQHIEARFNKTVVAMAMYDKDTQEIAKPSELLNSIRTYMDVLQTLENYVQIDVVRIFNNVLLQQTQHQDCYGEETLTTIYTRWYLEVLLRRVSNYQILYSGHLRTFVSNPMSEVATSFFPEEYTDYPGLHLNFVVELCALAEILGAYGMKFLSERLMWHVAGQISELKKLVLQNRESLRAMRTNFDRPDRMRELFRHLTVLLLKLMYFSVTDGNKKHLDAVDNLLQRVTIVGEIVCFRDLLRQGLNELVSERVPFLVNCMEDFKTTTCSGDKLDMLPVSEMFSAAGIKCIVDSDLVNALRAQKTDDAVDDDYNVCCLLMVFIAVSLTRLARSENFYHATLETHLNNSHCIPKAVNAIATALFSIHRREDIVDRMKEFLALASSCLLQMDEETDRDTLKNKDTAYIILEQIVEESPFLTNDILESCFPYILIRCAYRSCYQQAFVNSINNSVSA
ncbi:Nck-associated protein 1 [Trichinella spiralis]|uniref:Nck-associated protein 1 n=1 Tax=Trichinella spiralis TaxID=6334 RepID=A0A0V1BHF0_TRISP|nr:Nck-associated protein 1 [Trichinella spiralis]